MIAIVEMPKHREFEHQPERECGAEGEHQRQKEISGEAVEHHSEIGAEHVLHAVRQIDEIHDAKHQRRPGGDQEEKHAELQAVQSLDEKEAERHVSVVRDRYPVLSSSLCRTRTVPACFLHLSPLGRGRRACAPGQAA